MQLWLTLVMEDVDVLTFVLAPGASPMLGRDDSANDIVLHDPAVSRMHARIVARGEHFVRQDLGSTAGTYLGEQRVNGEVALPETAIIRIGPYLLRTAVRQWRRQDEDDADATVMLDSE